MSDKKGQALGIGIMSFIMLLIVGLMMANFIIDEVTNARVNLNCASASAISGGTKLLCLVVDITVPYWIIIIFSVAGGAVLAKLAMK